MHCAGMMPVFLFPMPIPTPDYPPPEGGDAPVDAPSSPDEVSSAPGELLIHGCHSPLGRPQTV